jgi:hypothetical protein
VAANKFHLNIASKFKQNDFFTSRSTVENELRYYMDKFKDKIVLCNCNDDENSEFFRYFQRLFEVLGLKKLIGTHFESEKCKPSYKLELYKDTNNDGKVTWKDAVIKTPIYGDDIYTAGDFRSKDCIEILKEADIVVTNPPFAFFREFLAQLVKYNKKFLIIGKKTFFGYKNVFPLFKDNKIWPGRSPCTDTWFRVPCDYDLSSFANTKIDENGNKILQINGIRWFTNLKTEYRQPPLQLVENYYLPEEYPKYDNYDAINVDKVADIPCDYPGVMGVPLTFIDKYCPEQFEIVGISGRGNNVNFKTKIYTKEDADNYGDHNAHPVLLKGGRLKSLYTRIFIKNMYPEESKYREKNIKEHVLNKAFDTDVA